ncbi:MAG TPA: DJ-1/PfpI family protein [Terriglobales bacterium]|nr:DJ-1/PfpI family protein [Terriglobales bacterium]
MRRRDFIRNSVALGGLAALPSCTRGNNVASAAGDQTTGSEKAISISNPLPAPAHGAIPVAFVVSQGTVMIDFAGPWEVFNSVMIPSRGSSMEDQMPFQTYAAAETLKPVSFSGGVKIEPNYTFASAPAPKVIVIPAQNGASKAMFDWITRMTKATDVTMSVCTGAFVLAGTGLLNGKPATTHHAAYRSFAIQFPEVKVQRGVRFAEDGNLATSGGLSSGIDLALHVVDRYFGRKVATNTAYNLEYQGQGWLNPNTNAVYLQAAVSTDEHPLCPVCQMEVDPKTAPKSVYQGKTYYFCSGDDKATFDKDPKKWM